jgi:hypothetical protein
VNFYDGRAIGVELPPSVVPKIVDTSPASQCDRDDIV